MHTADGAQKITVDPAYVREQLCRLIALDSRNPILSPGGTGERAVAEYIHAELGRLGLDAVLQATADPERPNVVATLPGTQSDSTPSLMLNGHMDTVNVEGMTSPFTPWERHGRVYGRGSQDMKGSLAVMLGIAACLQKAGLSPPGDLVLAFVADEEGDSIGSQALVQEYVCDQALVLEPTELHAAIAHRGFAWYTIHSEGKAAHGSRHQDGIDAIGNLGPLLHALHRLAAELLARPSSGLAGQPSLHASTIQGGTEFSVYPARCTLTLERRTAEDESIGQVTREIQALVDEANRELGSSFLSLELVLERKPFQTPADGALLPRLAAAYCRTMGQPLQSRGAPYWTDAAILAAAGFDCVLIGPTGFGLHTAEEWVDLDSLHQLGSIVLDTILHPAPAG